MTGEIAIKVRGLVSRFGDTIVHDGLDLDVFKGEVLCIVGPSGEGKSVLLRQVVGLERPAGGIIEVLGDPVDRHFDHAKRMGVMFQDGALFSKLSLLENVEVPFKEHTKVPAELMSQLASLKLVMAGLDAQTHHLKPAEISGGMRKRAALARALALDPELLFLDEPTAGLDPVTAARFDELLDDLAKALGLTVFLVTHDLDTLYEVADRVAVLHGGKVAAVGSLEEVQRSEDPWIKEYFRGPRGRAADRAHELAQTKERAR